MITGLIRGIPDFEFVPGITLNKSERITPAGWH